jgi:DNA-binding MltR family transcriptional regulator
MKYFYLKSITASIFSFLVISVSVVICSSINHFLNRILQKEILIVSVILTTILALFFIPLFKYFEENKS